MHRKGIAIAIAITVAAITSMLFFTDNNAFTCEQTFSKKGSLSKAKWPDSTILPVQRIALDPGNLDADAAAALQAALGKVTGLSISPAQAPGGDELDHSTVRPRGSENEAPPSPADSPTTAIVRVTLETDRGFWTPVYATKTVRLSSTIWIGGSRESAFVTEALDINESCRGLVSRPMFHKRTTQAVAEWLAQHITKLNER